MIDNVRQHSIDFDFIDEMESDRNGSVLENYISLSLLKPGMNEIRSLSYETLCDREYSMPGQGFDPDDYTLYDLQQMNLPADITLKIIPFIIKGKPGDSDALKSRPLVFTESEIELISLHEKIAHAKKLMRLYNMESRTLFSSIPAEAQTVLFSMTYQFGLTAVRGPLKIYWKLALAQKWQELSRELNSSNMFISRRKREAKLLNKISDPNYVILP